MNLALNRKFLESPPLFLLSAPRSSSHMTQESLTPDPSQPRKEIVASTGPPVVKPHLNTKQKPKAVKVTSSVGQKNAVNSDGSTTAQNQTGDVGATGIDQNLVKETKDQIRNLIQEISDLSRSDCTVEEFYEGFLMRTASALASVGGAIWVREPDQKHAELHYQINLKKTCLVDDKVAQTKHSLLLRKLMVAGQPTLVPPNSGQEGDDEAGNPTEYLLVIAPLTVDQETVGLIEILQRPGTGPATQRGYLRFLNRMSQIASDFLKDRRLRSFSDQQTMWQKVEQFIKSAHHSLDLKQTAYTIANEGRRLIECDRVTVALTEGKKQRVKSVSGLDSIERRAEQVKMLSKLATTVCKANEPLWYTGDTTELPPQVEKRLHDYVDKSHTKMLAILPLCPPASEENLDAKKQKPIGALIVEQLSDARIQSSTENRVAVVAEHGYSALNNSLDHNSIFLMPLWKVLGKLTAPFKRTNLFKTIAVFTLLGLIGFALCVVPYPFTLGANGHVTAVHQEEIFAKLDGTLIKISAPEDPYATIEAGHVLATMTNNDLMVEIEQLDGELNQARAELQKFARAESQELDNTEKIYIQGDLNKTERRIKGLEKALAFKQKQAEELTVRSPIRGQIVNWQPRRKLLGRPVRRGQSLMTVVAPDTLWEIDLEMPERRVGHLINTINDAAQNKSSSQTNDSQLKVTFSLVSDSSYEFTGQIVEVNRNLEVKSDDGNTATVRVQFDNEQVPPGLFRSGTRVRAKVDCGSRSIGYVMFHELIETTKTNLKYWF